MRADMKRRHALAHLGRQAAALALWQLFGPAKAQEPVSAARWPADAGDPFTLGVASGMPRPESVVIWTRLAPQPQAPGGGLPRQPFAVRWELAEDERFATGVRRGEFLARPERGHAVHVEVGGLASGRRYFYRFIAGQAVSPVGRTRTAPADDEPVRRLRLALASCQHYEQGWYAAHAEIAERDIDFVLFVGDYIYESSTSSGRRVRPHEGPVPRELDAYRARHATYKLDADLRAAHAAHPWVLTWDDHELENDYAGEASPSGLDAAAFLRRRAAAYQAYFEHLPVSPAMAPRGAAMRIHDHYRWGRLAELWTLDVRQFRSVQACGDGKPGGRVLSGCDELADPARTMLGAAQERWLAQGLAASQRPWKLIAQATQMSSSAIATPIGRRLYSDGWDGYPLARDRLLDAVAAAGGGNTLVLGGDVHRHVAAQLRQRVDDPRSPVVAAEFVCSSVTSRGLAEPLMAAIRSSNPDLLHARSDERGYAWIELTPQGAQCDFRATAHPAQPGAALHSQARFVVEAGRPGVARD